jgi:hypothetical protein
MTASCQRLLPLAGEGAATWSNRSIAGESDSSGDNALGNTSSSTTGGVTAVFDSASPDGTIARRSSPSAGMFIAEVLIITLVGIVVGVVLWTMRQRRKRSWAAIPDADSSRGSRAGAAVSTTSEVTAGSPSSSAARRQDDGDQLGEELPRVTTRVLSPPLSTASSRRGTSPRFTIGSDDEEDDFVPERTEL